jgi:hypothetical protein
MYRFEAQLSLGRTHQNLGQTVDSRSPTLGRNLVNL